MSRSLFAGVRALLFDVLHTLVDDSGFPRTRMRRLLEEAGHRVDPGEFESIYRSVTAREYDWEKAAVEEPFRSIRDRHEARVEAIYERLELTGKRDVAADTDLLWEHIATSRIYPEVPEVLPALEARGYRLALLSNADENDPVIRALLGAELPVTFDAVVTSQAVGAYKPARRIFERALQELGMAPPEVALVGDSPASDVLGGRLIGTPVIWLNRCGVPFPDGYPEPDATVSDLYGLLDLLPGIGAGTPIEAGAEG